jgi:signal peptidase I
MDKNQNQNGFLLHAILTVLVIVGLAIVEPFTLPWFCIMGLVIVVVGKVLGANMQPNNRIQDPILPKKMTPKDEKFQNGVYILLCFFAILCIFIIGIIYGSG